MQRTRGIIGHGCLALLAFLAADGRAQAQGFGINGQAGYFSLAASDSAKAVFGSSGGFMGGGGLLLVLLIVVVVVLLMRQPPSDTRRRSTPSSAEDVLADRFAQGEIDEAEYRRRLSALRS